ncbi:MAG: hypothetical protein KAJ42_17890, partial [Gemmatimonadetes bacterium]|nr:hypothetical protein [Gemmatimonadota bacterium]
RYFSEELGIEYDLKVVEERLMLETRKSAPRPLAPTFEDGFAYRGGSFLTFTRGADGSLDGFSISSGRVWKIRFDRVPG